MVDQLDYSELNVLVKHFLEFNGLNESAKTFDHEIRTKVLNNQARLQQQSQQKPSRHNPSAAQESENIQKVIKVNNVP